MTADVYPNRVVPRSASSQAAHPTFRPRHTCSAVTSGFFPPQPARLTGYEGQRHAAQRRVTHRGNIAPPLEGANPPPPLPQADGVFSFPTGEAHAQQPPQRRPLGGVGDEVLLLPRPHV